MGGRGKAPKIDLKIGQTHLEKLNVKFSISPIFQESISKCLLVEIYDLFVIIEAMI